MIKAIVFDLDGMVYDEGEYFSSRLSRDFGISVEVILPFFNTEFIDCQLGKLDMKKVIPKYLNEWGWKKSFDDLLEYWVNYGKLNQAIIDLIARLRINGIVCVLATNNEKYRFEKMNIKFGFSKIFDHLVNSYKIGARKPDKKFCDKICQITGLDRTEILVCDDKEGFIKKLDNYGFQIYLYQNLHQFIDELNKLGIDLCN